jgi:hypothetical protein
MQPARDHNLDSAMSSDKPSIPMLEAFLRQAEAPSGRVVPDKWEWPAAILALFLISTTNGSDFMSIVGILVAWAIIAGTRAFRKQQIAQLSPGQRMAFERWGKVRRMKKLLKDRRLYKKVPESVLMTLEAAARAWHDARETMSAVAVTDPEFATEVLGTIDASMSAAAAAADPVVLRDDQYRRDLDRFAEDSDLMARICMRIQQEEVRMNQFAAGSPSLQPETPSSLRERLEKARIERAAAEAELDALL